jgi:hypothetical protein
MDENNKKDETWALFILIILFFLGLAMKDIVGVMTIN